MSISHSRRASYGAEAKRILGYSRWWQIIAAAIMMALVSPYQYVWTALEGPLATELDASLSVIGFVFTLFVVLMAVVQFPAGWWRDRYGPRGVTVLAGILAGGGYYALAFVTEVWQLYLAYAVGSLGVGIVYSVAVNTAIKWFPDRRGLTAGIGTMAFALGSAAFIPYVRMAISAGQLSRALSNMGLLIGAGILIGTLVLADPPAEWETVVRNPTGTESASSGAEPREAEGSNPIGTDRKTRHYTWREMLNTWQFWVMYFMFFAVSAAGLMITARVILYAEHARLSATVTTIAATLLPIASGGGRLIMGGASDRFNRSNITAVSFMACGIATLVIVFFARLGSGVAYIISVAIAVFFWSSQFSLFPGLVGDYFGAKGSSTNYAFLYSGKMWGGVFGGGVVAWLIGILGWDIAFLIGGILALAGGIAGVFLKPP